MQGEAIFGQLDPQRRLVAILANPTAGKRPAGNVVDDLAAELRRRGFEAIVCRERERFSALTAERQHEIRCAVAAGGDGTVAEALNRGPEVPLAILPLGNENLVARHVLLGADVQRVAAIVEAGKFRQLDLARAGQRTFSLMASAGFDAEVVHVVHQGRHSHINRFSYAAAIAKALARYRFPQIEATILDTGECLRGAMTLAFNLPEYAFHLAIAPNARGDDGLLDLLVFERRGIWNLGRHLLSVLRGRTAELPDVQHRLVRKVRLQATGPAPLQIDGDPAGSLPCEIEVLPGALRLMVPLEGGSANG